MTIISGTIITVGKGNLMCATKMGRKRYVVRQVNGEESIREFYPVNMTPDMSAHVLPFLYLHMTCALASTSMCTRADMRCL